MLSKKDEGHNRTVPLRSVNGNSIINTYDGFGNVIAVNDKNSNVTTNTYDALGRLLKE